MKKKPVKSEKLKQHKQTAVQINGQSILIDKKISKLILAFSKCNIRTYWSCEEALEGYGTPNKRNKLLPGLVIFDYGIYVNPPINYALVMIRKEKQLSKLLNIIERPFDLESDKEIHRPKSIITKQGFFFRANKKADKLLITVFPIFSITEKKMSFIYKVYIPHSELKFVTDRLNKYGE